MKKLDFDALRRDPAALAGAFLEALNALVERTREAEDSLESPGAGETEDRITRVYLLAGMMAGREAARDQAIDLGLLEDSRDRRAAKFVSDALRGDGVRPATPREPTVDEVQEAIHWLLESKIDELPLGSAAVVLARYGIFLTEYERPPIHG